MRAIHVYYRKIKKALRQLNSTGMGWKDMEMENQSWREKSGSSGSTGRWGQGQGGSPWDPCMPHLQL